MQKKLKNSFGFRVLFVLIGTSCSLTPALGESLFDTSVHSQEQTELANQQSSVSQAFGNYFEALMSGSKEKAKVAEQNLDQAQGRVGAFLSEQHNQTIKTLFGKYYFRDGSSVDIAEYDRDPQRFAKLENPSPAELARAHSTTEIENDSGMRRSNSMGIGQESNAREEIVLDGSNIPRELIFSGKSAPKKKAFPARRPASRR